MFIILEYKRRRFFRYFLDYGKAKNRKTYPEQPQQAFGALDDSIHSKNRRDLE